MNASVSKVASKVLANRLHQAGIQDARVLQAVSHTPREIFIDPALAHQAYENTALPIGLGQTISQPYIVARMTELALQVNPSRVLEIGTGSGYQSAILAQLVSELFTIERIKSLQILARKRLKKLDLHNVSFKYGDGWQGWSSRAPFDVILVTAAASSIPFKLTDQLVVGGKLIIPVGELEQKLLQITKTHTGIEQQVIESVRFVPLIQGELA